MTSAWCMPSINSIIRTTNRPEFAVFMVLQVLCVGIMSCEGTPFSRSLHVRVSKMSYLQKTLKFS